MDLNAYLNFDGTCADAFTFYQQHLGGELMMHTFGDSPMKDQMPAEWADKIMHAQLTVGDTAVMGSDAPPGYFAAPQGIHVAIGVATAAEGERIFKALSEQGKVTMPFEPTFWSSGFGMLVDRFGIPWMVNAEPPAA